MKYIPQNKCYEYSIKDYDTKIIGCQLFICQNIENKSSDNTYPLLLIAKTKKGYYNLCKLNSIAYCKGFYFRPRIDFDILEMYAEDLICICRCEKREVFAEIFEKLFGNDFYRTNLEITPKIIAKCDFNVDKLEFGKTKEYAPKYPCLNGLNEDEYLDKLCIEGLKEKYGNPIPDFILERYEKEKDIVFDSGISSYFLYLYDIIKWAKEQKISFGQARGTLAGSLIAYALDITKLDPVCFNLNFETSDKFSIGFDFCKYRCEEVFDYLVEKFGKEQITKVVPPNDEDDPKEIGIVITSCPADELIAVKLLPDAFRAIVYPKAVIEKIGFFKIDFEKSETITIINETLDFIYQRYEIKFDIDKIPLDDIKTLKSIYKGEINTFEDLVDLYTKEFSKNDSLSYAFLEYQSVYLKTHYPEEYKLAKDNIRW